MGALHLIIVSGLSGSGKSFVLKCFEDIGYFCVDNLPPALLPKFVELCVQQGGEVTKVALGIDIRERGFFQDLFDNLDRLKALGYSADLVFLEARDEVLIRRFSESRRPHPLAPNQSVQEGVLLERERLGELRRRAGRIIDTSDLTVHELKTLIAKFYWAGGDGAQMTLSLMSFGFKYGVPYDVDLLFDVRFLRNPNFVGELKPLTGHDQPVQQYVFADQAAEPFFEHIERLLLFLLPLYERERRSYLTIGIGCTGGRHRSVAVVDRLRDQFSTRGRPTAIRHRDIDKG